MESELKHLRGDLEQLETTGQPAEERREGSPFGKREEEATESFELEKRMALENKIKAELGEVEHALSKFTKGTYGLCDMCRQAINPERLEALPQARLCMSCKAKHPGV